jgi:hypothetical protein
MRHFGVTSIAGFLIVFLLVAAGFLIVFLLVAPPVSSQSRSCYSPRSCAIAAAFQINARAIEPDLPDIPLIDWLQQVGGPDAKITTGTWDESWGTCEGVQSEADPPADVNAAWQVCAQATILLPDRRVVSLALSAQILRAWRPLSVRFGNGFVIDQGNQGNGALDVRSLRDLPGALLLPARAWPRADLRIDDNDLRIEPDSARSGDSATVTVTVRNVGADLARVRVYITGIADCSDIGNTLATLSGRIPPGDAWTSQTTVVIPTIGPGWWLSAHVDLMSVAQGIRKIDINGRTGGIKSVSRRVGAAPTRNCRFPLKEADY